MTPADPCPVTTVAVLARAAGVVPDIESVVCDDGRVTYAQLQDRVARAQRVLRDLGVGRGTRVALCFGNSARWMELFYAVTGLGAVAIPVNTRYRADELAYALRQSRASILVTADRVLSTDVTGMLRDRVPELEHALPSADFPDLRHVCVDATAGSAVPPGASSWPELLKRVPATGAELINSAAPDDVALVQYTSGTTARPKGVLLTHRNMCLDAWHSGLRMGLRAADRFHSVRPFFHVAGSTLSVLTSAQHCTTLVTMLRFEPGRALEVLEAERCTHFSGNDTIALMLLDHPDRSRRRLVLRGAWVAASATVVRRVAAELGAAEVVVGYGLSEASPNVAQSAWWEPAEVRLSGAMLPEPGVRVRLRDRASGELSPTGRVGEIEVNGWNVMRGYLDDAAATAEVLDAEGWLRTGDLGRFDDTGRLHFVGRDKEIIRVGGENVAPSEVEDLLLQHPEVLQAAVVGVPDPRLIEVPFAFVRVRETARCDENDLVEWARPRIASFKVPRYVRIVTDFSEVGMTASSKIQKHRLAAIALEQVRT